MTYQERISRNIGLLTQDEQEQLRTSTIAILGNGGIGGPIALNLCYAGCQHLVLADFDTVEPSNLNRQPFTSEDIGKNKADVLSEHLKRIDPELQIRIYHRLDERNIDEVLSGVKFAVLSLDGPAGSILVTRAARKKGIPVIEGWTTPFLFARWFTWNSIEYESCYGLSTQSLSFSELENNKDIQKQIYRKFVDFVFSIPGIKEFYQRDPVYFQQFMEGKLPTRSFAPYVWGNAMFVVHELIFAGILEKKPKTLAPNVIAFDPLSMRIITMNE